MNKTILPAVVSALRSVGIKTDGAEILLSQFGDPGGGGQAFYVTRSGMDGQVKIKVSDSAGVGEVVRAYASYMLESVALFANIGKAAMLDADQSERAVDGLVCAVVGGEISGDARLLIECYNATVIT